MQDIILQTISTWLPARKHVECMSKLIQTNLWQACGNRVCLSLSFLILPQNQYKETPQGEESLPTFTASSIMLEGHSRGPISKTGVCSGATIIFARPAPCGPTIMEAVANSCSCEMMGPVPQNSATSNPGNSLCRARRT